MPFRSHTGSQPLAVVYAKPARATFLCSVLPRPWITANSSAEVLEVAQMHRTVVFCDVDKLGELGDLGLATPIVALVDRPDASRSALSVMVERVELTPWLAHAITPALLDSPLATAHLSAILKGFAPSLSPPEDDGIGRVALLATASKRAARIERMHDFFERKGIPDRTLAALDVVAEELVMNALYAAPAEAGYFAWPVQPTTDVELEPERACEISYGLERDCSFVRVRDSFGSLSRARLSKVLGRCNRGVVDPDESRGGLGLWRVLSAASTVSITVVPNKLTDIVVRIAPSNGRAPRTLVGLDLWFSPTRERQMREHVPYDISDLEDDSVTLLRFD